MPNRGLFSERNERIAKTDRDYASVDTDTGLITGRDGRSFNLWPEAIALHRVTPAGVIHAAGRTLRVRSGSAIGLA